LPSVYVPERLYGELEEIFASGGWSLNEVKFSNNKDETEYPGLAQYDVTLSVSSIDYSGLKNLLHLLENNLRLIDVTNLSFSPDNNAATIGLRTYYYNAQ